MAFSLVLFLLVPNTGSAPCQGDCDRVRSYFSIAFATFAFSYVFGTTVDRPSLSVEALSKASNFGSFISLSFAQLLQLVSFLAFVSGGLFWTVAFSFSGERAVAIGSSTILCGWGLSATFQVVVQVSTALREFHKGRSAVHDLGVISHDLHPDYGSRRDDL